MFFGWLTGGQMDNTLRWNGDSNAPVTVKLRAQNSQGVAYLEQTISPSSNPPIEPPEMLPRADVSISGTTITAAVSGFESTYATVYVEKPGSSTYLRAGDGTLTSPGTYTFNYAPPRKGKYAFQVFAGRLSSGVWSNPVTARF
jgi:hypothetical protein